MQDLVATIKAEVKRDAQAGKMAIVGESMATQTEDNGTARKFTELAVKVMVVLDKVVERDKNNSDTIASKLEEIVKLQIAGCVDGGRGFQVVKGLWETFGRWCEELQEACGAWIMLTLEGWQTGCINYRGCMKIYVRTQRFSAKVVGTTKS
jgi:hypothetical protein